MQWSAVNHICTTKAVSSFPKVNVLSILTSATIYLNFTLAFWEVRNTECEFNLSLGSINFHLVFVQLGNGFGQSIVSPKSEKYSAGEPFLASCFASTIVRVTNCQSNNPQPDSNPRFSHCYLHHKTVHQPNHSSNSSTLGWHHLFHSLSSKPSALGTLLGRPLCC